MVSGQWRIGVAGDWYGLECTAWRGGLGRLQQWRQKWKVIHKCVAMLDGKPKANSPPAEVPENTILEAGTP